MLNIIAAALQVADFHPEIFVEAAAARERMRTARLLQEPPAAAAVLEYAAEEEVSSGMVAEALSLLAVGELYIQTHDVTVSQLLPRLSAVLSIVLLSLQ